LLQADKIQLLWGNPAEGLTCLSDASNQARIVRICCPYLRFRAPTPTIEQHCIGLQSLSSSTLL